MVRVSSIFSQLLSLIDRAEFLKLVKVHQADRPSKGYSCWGQFVAMLFCQLAQAKSIREICGGLACCLGKMHHLGLREAPNKSTLSYANTHRPWEMYQDLFYQVLKRCRARTHGHRFRFKNKLLSLDSSTISLCLSLFPWADYRRTKGAVKLHLLLDHDGYLPSYAYISNGKRSDVKVARDVALSKGSIVAMDRGYHDYTLFREWTRRGIYFVTRLKDNARYYVDEERGVPRHRNILADQIIFLADYDTCPYPLRRIVVWDSTKEREIVLLTNHRSFGSSTIAAIDKDRWQIELFFKALKQNLKVKTFVGTSGNALFIQIWTALIAMLLIKYLQFRSKYAWSLSNLVALLHWNLFTYRDLWDWLNDPFETPALVPRQIQQVLFA
ncbi:MAG TPA: IS4 family transposase [Synergistales bacterium]|nr:IS4 family transposase [Synergistales bacterium]